MAGNTSRSNLPYPSGTDRVRFGASNIQALATAVDPGVVITIPLHPSADAAQAYPYGVTMFAVALADAQADGGWPMLASGFVVTTRLSNSYCSQTWYRASTASPDVYTRQMLTAANSPWTKSGGADFRSQTSTTATGSITAAVWTQPQCGTLENNYGNLTGDSTGILVPGPGTFRVTAFMEWAGAATGGRRLIGFGGPSDSGPRTFLRSSMPPPDNSAQDQTYADTITITEPAGGRISVWVLHNASASLTIGNRRVSVQRITAT